MNKGFILLEAIIVLCILSIVSNSILSINNINLKNNHELTKKIENKLDNKNKLYESIDKECDERCVLKKALLVLKQ